MVCHTVCHDQNSLRNDLGVQNEIKIMAASEKSQIIRESKVHLLRREFCFLTTFF